MKKKILFFTIIPLFILSFFCLQRIFLEDFFKDSAKEGRIYEDFFEDDAVEYVTYEGNFKERVEDDVNFNNSVISGVVVKIENFDLYVSPSVQSKEMRLITLNKDTQYFKINIDSNYKELSKEKIEKESIKAGNSVVVVPQFVESEGGLDFSRAKEVRIINENR